MGSKKPEIYAAGSFFCFWYLISFKCLGCHVVLTFNSWEANKRIQEFFNKRAEKFLTLTTHLSNKCLLPMESN